MDELVNLAGVGRKTANVVLGNAFEIPGVVVDTHVMRLTNRLGLVDSDDPVEIEHKLMEFIDQKYWTLLAHLLISHGRAICIARKPLCEKCALNKLCPKRI
jgi:endonuclease III